MLARARRNLAAVPTADAVIAVAVLALGQVEVWGGVVEGPAALGAPILALGTLPLAWRRRRPLAVAGLVGASFVLGAAASIGTESLGQLIAVVVAVYSVGALVEMPRSAGVLPYAYGCAAVSVIAAGEGGASDLLFAAFVVVAPWAVGRLVGGLGRQAEALEDRAERLAYERDVWAREAAAAERGRIARELHDIVAHSVSVMVVQAGGAEELLESSPERAREALRSVRETGQQALVEMRRMVGLLRLEGDGQEGLTPQPRMAQLEELVAQARAAGLPTELRVAGTPRGRLPPGVDLSAFRILQEALTNARKHAGEATASVTVRWTDDAVELEVVDDGRGAVDGDGGHGLIGMRERAALFGGEVRAGPEPGGGFAVRARLPIASPAP